MKLNSLLVKSFMAESTVSLLLMVLLRDFYQFLMDRLIAKWSTRQQN